MKNMNQQILINEISKRFFLTKAESKEIVQFLIDKITEDISNSQRFYLRGFGSFVKEKRAKKRVRHPKTGKIITIPEHITVKFNPSKSLLEKLK